jgi:hypothetical protein
VQRILTQAGDASPEEVWRRYADLGAWPRWAPFIQAVDSPVVLGYLLPAQLALRSLVRV